MRKRKRKRHVALKALAVMGLLALLVFICRLWPLLLVIILGIFIGALRLLFRAMKKEEAVEPEPMQTEPAKQPAGQPTEADVRKLAYSVILRRITEHVLYEYPEARWVWETADVQKKMETGGEAFILLNRAGGYRRARVILRNLQFVGIEYNPDDYAEEWPEEETEQFTEEEEPEEQNFELLAFEWVDAHIFELDARCNEAIGGKLSELVLPAEELPVPESWPDICRELARAGLEDVSCVPEGIRINLTQ